MEHTASILLEYNFDRASPGAKWYVVCRYPRKSASSKIAKTVKRKPDSIRLAEILWRNV